MDRAAATWALARQRWRAAFKACQDARQVVILCPTTILAQQHYETLFSRFAPLLKVSVLSRFVTPAQQKKRLRIRGRSNMYW